MKVEENTASKESWQIFKKGQCFDLSPKTDGNVDPQKFRTQPPKGVTLHFMDLSLFSSVKNYNCKQQVIIL